MKIIIFNHKIEGSIFSFLNSGLSPTSAVHQVIKTSWLTPGLGISSVEAARFVPAPQQSVEQQPAVQLLALCTPPDNGKQKPGVGSKLISFHFFIGST